MREHRGGGSAAVLGARGCLAVGAMAGRCASRGADRGRAVFFRRERFDGVMAAESDDALLLARRPSQPSLALPCRANGPASSPGWVESDQRTGKSCFRDEEERDEEERNQVA